MRAFGIILGAIGTIFVFFVNWTLGFATIVVAIILLLIAKKPEGLKKCPKCAEEVKVEALVCRFCSYEFPKEILAQENIDKNESSENLESLRIKFNELAGKIILSRDPAEKVKLHKERAEIEKEMERLKKEGIYKEKKGGEPVTH